MKYAEYGSLPVVDWTELAGREITHTFECEFDDTDDEYLELYTTNPQGHDVVFVIVSAYGGYTGKSCDEYPNLIPDLRCKL